MSSKVLMLDPRSECTSKVVLSETTVEVVVRVKVVGQDETDPHALSTVVVAVEYENEQTSGSRSRTKPILVCLGQ